MNNQRIILEIMVLSSPLYPIIGMVIGLIRYKKHKKRVIDEVRQDYQNAQKAGGFKSLFYKHQHKRIFAKTFGLPVGITFLLGLAVMLFAFSKL